MKIYQVGGSIRDELLGLPVQDRDWVVVGGTPEQMVLAGFKPVGKDFPVFLHPVTDEEYALARTERKTAPGYAGFSFHAAPDVTLEDDLSRRDLTINAMAREATGGPIVDPYGGQADLTAKRFRHVGPAFAEDPVRILRLARFAARLTDFTVAPDTDGLMRGMVQSGEVDALVAERVWQEFARGLQEVQPQRMFDVLRACGALVRVAPAWEAATLPDALPARALRHAATLDLSLPVRFACLMMHASETAIRDTCEAMRIPADCRDLALVVCHHRATLLNAGVADAGALATLFQAADAYRRQERFFMALSVIHCEVAAEGDAHAVDTKTAIKRLTHALAKARSVDAGAIAREHPGDIPNQLTIARKAAIHGVLQAFDEAPTTSAKS
jgi:tRNA nucleotidyltransferase (CCA-adding enzyme)